MLVVENPPAQCRGRPSPIAMGDRDSSPLTRTLRRRKSSKLGDVLRKFLGQQQPKHHTYPLPDSGKHTPVSDFITGLDGSTRPYSTPAARNRKAGGPLAVEVDGGLLNHRPQYQDKALLPRSPVSHRASMPDIGSDKKEQPIETVFWEGSEVTKSEIEERGRTLSSSSQKPHIRAVSVEALPEVNESELPTPRQRPPMPESATSFLREKDSMDAMQTTEAEAKPERGKAHAHHLSDVPTILPNSIEPQEMVHLMPETQQPDLTARGSFDFKGFVSNLQRQEQIPVEERLTTLEVKMMDHENAISKLQQHQPVYDAGRRSLPTQVPRDAEARSVRTSNSRSNYVLPPISGIEQGRAGTPGGLSHIATPSMGSIDSQANDYEAPADKASRPASNLTALRQPLDDRETQSPNRQLERRDSLTSMTIDQYSTIVNLLRHEQKARLRLEDQVSELRHELYLLRNQLRNTAPTNHSGTFYRSRGWSSTTSRNASRNASRKNSANELGKAVHQMPSYEDFGVDHGSVEATYPTSGERRREYGEMPEEGGRI